MKKYYLTVKHDSGKTVISAMAWNIQEAIEQVMDAERCPRRAIVAARIGKHGKNLFA